MNRVNGGKNTKIMAKHYFDFKNEGIIYDVAASTAIGNLGGVEPKKDCTKPPLDGQGVINLSLT